MRKQPASAFSVAMSADTGCIVMVRTNGKKATVIGSLTREQSLKFSRDLIDWSPPKPERALPAYPH